MKYSEVALTISSAEAADVISESVTGVRRTQDGDSYVYKTNSGTTLAILGPAPRRDAESVLRYRSTMISPQLATARRKARAIRDALNKYYA